MQQGGLFFNNLLRSNIDLLHRIRIGEVCWIVVEEQQRRRAEERQQLTDGQVRFTYFVVLNLSMRGMNASCPIVLMELIADEQR